MTRAILLALALVATPASARTFDFGAPDSGTRAVALSHAGFSLAAPLAGHYAAGRRGLWLAGGAWIAASVAQQAFLHGPQRGPETRTDLVTKLGPCLVVLAVDLWRHGWTF